MNKHSKAYEQYCCVLKKNVIVEEISYHDGTKEFSCTNTELCHGCKNNILKEHFSRTEKNTVNSN